MNEFRTPGVIYIIFHYKNMQPYITCSIPFDLKKTQGWSPTLLSKYTVGNLASGQMGWSNEIM